MKPVRPADVTVVLAAAQGTSLDGGVTADGVAFYLRTLGFEATAQQAASWLRRVSRLNLPPVVVLRHRWHDYAVYRVTCFGRILVSDRLGLRLEGEFPHPSEIEGERENG